MPGAQSDIAEIEALEDRRYAAMLDVDLETLKELLHEDMIYSHSTGGMDTKEMYIASLRDKVSIYKNVDLIDRTVHVTGDIGLAFHHVQITAVHHGNDLYLDNRLLAVWTRDNGVWRLLAVQSGAIPPQIT
ncbi:MAG: nuclear transport factor 2 family protein [Alphaproteobacteria bacterium]|nr:nuclear transport factor 2 family protein [Alphaproteobacteria bacterium]